MQRPERPTRSPLLSFPFLATSILGGTVMGLVGIYGNLPTQIAVLGVWVSVLGGLFLEFVGRDEERDRTRSEALQRLGVPLALTSDPELFAHHRTLSELLLKLLPLDDPVLRDITWGELAGMAERLEHLARGEVDYVGTEAWRTVYDRVLTSPGVSRYRSVAWVRTRDYWQDAPARKSLRANYLFVAQGGALERIVILADGLWTDEGAEPVEPVRTWIVEQVFQGIRVSVVRESALGNERDLLTDFGVYGDRAVGSQLVDAGGRTERFTLHFDPEAVRAALDRWERLLLYAVPVRPR
jgi:hypothetical protein